MGIYKINTKSSLLHLTLNPWEPQTHSKILTFQKWQHIILQFSLVTQSCLTPCDLMDCSMPGFPVHIIIGVWLLFTKCDPLKFIQVVYINSSSLFIAKSCSVVWMYYSLFNQLPVGEHLGCFQFLATTNGAAMSNHNYTDFYSSSFLWDKCQGVYSSRAYKISDCHNAIPFYTPIIKWSSFSASSPEFGVLIL